MDLTRCVLLSLTPQEYADEWFNYEFARAKSMSGAMKNLLAFFNEYFSDYLNIGTAADRTEESQSEEFFGVSLPFKLMLPERQPLLSAVEY